MSITRALFDALRETAQASVRAVAVRQVRAAEAAPPAKGQRRRRRKKKADCTPCAGMDRAEAIVEAQAKGRLF